MSDGFAGHINADYLLQRRRLVHIARRPPLITDTRTMIWSLYTNEFTAPRTGAVPRMSRCGVKISPRRKKNIIIDADSNALTSRYYERRNGLGSAMSPSPRIRRYAPAVTFYNRLPQADVSRIYPSPTAQRHNKLPGSARVIDIPTLAGTALHVRQVAAFRGHRFARLRP